MNSLPTKLVNTNSLGAKKQPLFKAVENYMEKYKLEIIKWMNTLTQMQRASIMIIRDPNLLRIIGDMIAKEKYDQMGYYLESADSKIYSRDVFRYKEKGNYSVARIKAAEKEILRNILIFKDTHQITFSKSFISKYESLLEHISIMTNDMMFTYLLADESGGKNSVWFRPREFHSMCEWLIHAFQEQILKHFLEGKYPKPYEPLLKLSAIESFVSNKLKLTYFSADRIKKLYKDERIQKNDQGKKHRELNMYKIIELVSEKTDQEILDDIFFNKLIKHQDASYFVYLNIIRPIIDQEYIDYTLDELTKVQQELKEAKPKAGKKNKNRKRKSNKKEPVKSEELMEPQFKDTDDTMTETMSSKTKQIQSKNEIIVETKKHYKEKKEKKASYTEIHYEQTPKIEQERYDVEDKSKSLEKKTKKKRPQKKVNALINNHLKEYIDEFSNSSNKLLRMRRIAFNRLEATIANILKQQKLFFNFSLRLFGSCALGLSTEQSDIDIVLLLDTSDNVDLIVLEIIHKRLEDQKWIVNNKLINCAVPLVKLDIDLSVNYKVDTNHYNITKPKLKNDAPLFQIDLSIETKGSQNLNQGIKSTEYTLSILQTYKNMRSIILFLKIFIKARKLDLTFNGGINSYVLFLLVFAFLKHNHYLQSTEIFIPLIELLEYYSSSFDIQSIIIDVRQQKCFIETIPILQKLTIIDPLAEKDRYVNTNSSQIAKIFCLFKQLHQQLIGYKETVSCSEDLGDMSKKNLYSTLQSNFNELMTDTIF